jgi:hypothetical protein
LQVRVVAVEKTLTVGQNGLLELINAAGKETGLSSASSLFFTSSFCWIIYFTDCKLASMRQGGI